MGKDLSAECKLAWKKVTMILAMVFELGSLDHTDKILGTQWIKFCPQFPSSLHNIGGWVFVLFVCLLVFLRIRMLSM